jgi:hypothetical protein
MYLATDIPEAHPLISAEELAFLQAGTLGGYGGDDHSTGGGMGSMGAEEEEGKLLLDMPER